MSATLNQSNLNDQDWNRLEIIKLLIQDRNHHFQHIHDTNTKFLYAIGGTLVSAAGTVWAAVVTKQGLDSDFTTNWIPVILSVILLIAGYVFVVWGLKEHTWLHSSQRKRIEKAISYLSNPANTSMEIFWKEFGETTMVPGESRVLSSLVDPTPLFAAEPDMRKGWHFHDGKIMLGMFFIGGAFAVFIGQLCIR